MKTEKYNLIVLSKSKIKQQAIAEAFPVSLFNDICFVEVPDNPNRPLQPLFIEGTMFACNQRIDLSKNKQNKNEYIISIENGLMPLDKSINKDNLDDFLWGDFCIIGLYDGNFFCMNLCYFIGNSTIFYKKISDIF
jgi:hypothetical protein